MKPQYDPDDDPPETDMDFSPDQTPELDDDDLDFEQFDVPPQRRKKILPRIRFCEGRKRLRQPKRQRKRVDLQQ